MDPITTAGAGLALYGSKELLIKLLGPSADYIGGEAKNLVEKCNVNLNRVFKRAGEKLDSRLDDTGGVSPRVLRLVYEDGKFAEDEVVVEYYGGLLAGSKTADGRDDQALPYLSKIQQMSVYQLRSHFLIYYELLRLYKSVGLNLAQSADCSRAGLIIPHELFIGALPQFDVAAKYSKIAGHVFSGLHQHGLLTEYAYGDVTPKIKDFPGAPGNALYVTPTFVGAELFMWALGVESPSGHDFFKLDIETIEQPIPIQGSAFAMV